MMKRNKLIVIITFVLAILFTFSLSKNNAYEDYFSDYEQEPLISMDLQDANLKDVLKIFSQQSGLNFIASEAIKDRRITLYLDKVSVEEALDKILSANNLTYELDKKNGIFIVKELGRPGIERITKVFYLKYARVSGSHINKEISDKIGNVQQTSGIKDAIEKILTTEGKVVEDIRTNSLIVTDTPNNFGFIERTISQLDIPTPQVLIEVEMLDVSKNAVDQMGIKWPASLASLDMTLVQRATAFPFTGSKFENTSARGAIITSETATPSGWNDVSWDTNSFGPTILTVVGKQLVLNFLKTQTDTKYLARPRILTLSNETAEIKITTNESVGIKETTTSAGGTTGTSTVEPERTETGVSLRVTPQVNPESGDITMFIEPEVSEARAGNSFTVANQTYTYRDPEKRGTKSTVLIKDSQTIVIGGLMRTNFSQTETKLPLLGDIPLLGALFRHKDKSKDETRELVIFITPHIVKEPMFNEALSQLSTQGLNREQVPSSRVVEIDRALDKIEDKRL